MAGAVWRISIALCVLFSLAHHAASAGRQLRVFTKTFSPLVFGLNHSAINANGWKVEDTAALQGYSVDVWHHIAAQLGYQTEWFAVDTVPQLLASVIDCSPAISSCLPMQGRGDVAIAGITITSTRETLVDFSHVYYESGLMIMGRNEAQERGEIDTLAIVDAVFSDFFFQIIIVILLSILLGAHIIWVMERSDHRGLFRPTYPDGIRDALWWVSVTVLNGGGNKPRRYRGQMFAVLLMFFGLIVVAVMVSFFEVTLSEIVSDEPDSFPEVPKEIRGELVGAIGGTTTAALLPSLGIPVIEFTSYTALVNGLLDRSIDYVVYDAPVLLFSCLNDVRLKCARHPFGREYYGIAVKENSTLRDEINVALLAFVGSEEESAIRVKWFGNPQEDDAAAASDDHTIFPVNHQFLLGTAIIFCIALAATCFAIWFTRRRRPKKQGHIAALLAKSGVLAAATTVQSRPVSPPPAGEDGKSGVSTLPPLFSAAFGGQHVSSKTQILDDATMGESSTDDVVYYTQEPMSLAGRRSRSQSDAPDDVDDAAAQAGLRHGGDMMMTTATKSLGFGRSVTDALAPAHDHQHPQHQHQQQAVPASGLQTILSSLARIEAVLSVLNEKMEEAIVYD